MPPAAAAQGRLFLGAHALAADVTSFALRGGGAGGPALLYTSRSSQLHVVMLARPLQQLLQAPPSAAVPAGCGWLADCLPAILGL